MTHSILYYRYDYMMLHDISWFLKRSIPFSTGEISTFLVAFCQLSGSCDLWSRAHRGRAANAWLGRAWTRSLQALCLLLQGETNSIWLPDHLIHFLGLSSTFINFHQLSSTFINFHQLSSTFINFHQNATWLSYTRSHSMLSGWAVVA